MKRVILWTGPRSVSAPFYRSITTLQNTRTKCIYEVFCWPHYFGPPAERRSSRYDAIEEAARADMICEPTYQAAKDVLQQDFPDCDLMFAKELAYTLPETMYEEVAKMSNIQHTFLIRDPKRVIYSMFKMSDSLTYDKFAPSETGYKQLCDLYRVVKKNSSTPPIIVDAYDVQAHPADIMKLYCDGIGIQFESHMTSWEPGHIPGATECWKDCRVACETSSGFIQIDYSEQKPLPLDELPKEVLDCIDQCQPYYEEMLAERIKPQ